MRCPGPPAPRWQPAGPRTPRMARMDTIISVALPNVALSSPPTVALVCPASCSVTKPSRSAQGGGGRTAPAPAAAALRQRAARAALGGRRRGTERRQRSARRRGAGCIQPCAPASGISASSEKPNSAPSPHFPLSAATQAGAKTSSSTLSRVMRTACARDGDIWHEQTRTRKKMRGLGKMKRSARRCAGGAVGAAARALSASREVRSASALASREGRRAAARRRSATSRSRSARADPSALCSSWSPDGGPEGNTACASRVGSCWLSGDDSSFSLANAL